MKIIEVTDVHVIGMNDFPAHAFIGDKVHALGKMHDLQMEDFKKQHFHQGSFEDYRARCHWHIRTVAGTIEQPKKSRSKQFKNFLKKAATTALEIFIRSKIKK